MTLVMDSLLKDHRFDSRCTRMEILKFRFRKSPVPGRNYTGSFPFKGVTQISFIVIRLHGITDHNVTVAVSPHIGAGQEVAIE